MPRIRHDAEAIPFLDPTAAAHPLATGHDAYVNFQQFLREINLVLRDQFLNITQASK